MRSLRALLLVVVTGWAFAQTGALEPGDPRLASGEYYDLYTYTASAPVALLIELASDDFDVYVMILDPNNALVAEFDDTDGFGTNLRETVILSEPGAYSIVVTSAFAGETGAYSMQITEGPVLSKGKTPTAPTTAGAPVNAPVTAAPASASEAQPGLVVGRVLMPDGSPINLPDATITVWISGVGFQSGQNVSFSTNPKADGSYAQRVPDGSYRVTARIEVPFDGQRFRLELAPNGPRVGDRDSTNGIAQDFTLRSSGQKPDTTTDSTDPFDYYGAYIRMGFQIYRQDTRSAVQEGPPGTRVVFTLTPTGPLIDGTRAPTLTFERAYGNNFDGRLLDIPIGTYTLTGIEIAPDGSITPLLMQTGANTFGDALAVRFVPAFYGGTGAETPILGFTRNMP